MSFDSNRSGQRRHSCGNAEVGVVLSDHQPMAATLHQVEDITAEVDEREESSDEYERS